MRGGSSGRGRQYYRWEVRRWPLEMDVEGASGCTGGRGGCSGLWAETGKTGAAPALLRSITEGGPVVGR